VKYIVPFPNGFHDVRPRGQKRLAGSVACQLTFPMHPFQRLGVRAGDKLRGDVKRNQFVGVAGEGHAGTKLGLSTTRICVSAMSCNASMLARCIS